MKKMSRRADLLAKGQRMSKGDYGPPAIHPRYRGTYRYMYDESRERTSSLGLRVLISLCLFLAFTAADMKHLSLSGIDCHRIAQSIEKEYTFSEMRDSLHGRQGDTKSD